MKDLEIFNQYIEDLVVLENILEEKFSKYYRVDLYKGYFKIAFFNYFLSPLRASIVEPKFVEKIIRGCSYYIANYILEIINKYDPDARMELAEGKLQISLYSGLGKERLLLIEDELRSLIFSKVDKSSVFSGQVFQVLPSHNVLEIFVLQSIFFAVSDIKTRAVEEEKKIEIVKRLSTEFANSYAEIFPQESFGKMPEVYLELITAGYNMAFILGEDIAQSFSNYLKDLRFEGLPQQFFLNLLRLPVSNLRILGVLGLISLEEKESFIKYYGHLRSITPVIKKASDKFCLNYFGLEYGYAHYQKRGALPWLFIEEDISTILFSRFDEFSKFLFALESYNYEESIRCLQSMINKCEDVKSEEYVALVVQLSYLQLIHYDFNSALDQASKLLSVQSDGSNPLLSYVLSRIYKDGGEVGQALKAAVSSFRLISKKSLFFDKIVENHAELLATSGLYQDAIDLLDLAISESKNPYPLLFLRYLSEKSLKRKERTLTLEVMSKINPFEDKTINLIYLG